MKLSPLIQGKTNALMTKIAGLQDMVHMLTSLAIACNGDHRAHCPILQLLETNQDGEDYLSIRLPSGHSSPLLQ